MKIVMGTRKRTHDKQIEMTDLLTHRLVCDCNPGFVYKTPTTFGKHFESNRHISHAYWPLKREKSRLERKLDNTERVLQSVRSSNNRLTGRVEEDRVRIHQLMNRNNEILHELDRIREQLAEAQQQTEQWKEKYSNIVSASTRGLMESLASF